MSKLIALEASSDACSVALLLDEKVYALHELAPRSHAQRLLPMVQQLLLEHSVSLKDLDAIAFGRGPGSFTGLRIAAGVTQGLAFGTDLPVVAVSTLEALVKGVQRQGVTKGLVLPLIDARMEEVYSALYQFDDSHNYKPIAEERVCKPADIPFLESLKKAEKLTLLGSGSNLLFDALNSAGIKHFEYDEHALPHAQDLIRIAEQKLLDGETLSAEQAIPVYLRGASAWKKSDQQKSMS